MNNCVLIIIGPTAVGKTKYSVEIAKRMDGEIVSADSMQIYKFMDIGSAKPGPGEMGGIPHHMVGEIDPFDTWSVAEYQKEAKSRISQILNRGKLPVVSGGTGLYVNSLIYDMDFALIKEDETLRNELQLLAETSGSHALHDRLKRIDPAGAARIHPNNVKKVIRAIEVAESTGGSVKDFADSFKNTNDYNCVMIGLKMDRDILYDRIEKRVDEMVDSGLFREVEHLRAMGLTEKHTSMKGIGYKEILAYLNGECDSNDAVCRIKQNTRNYAKRQMTWFRRYRDIRWFDVGNDLDFERCAGDIVCHITQITGKIHISRETGVQNGK